MSGNLSPAFFEGVLGGGIQVLVGTPQYGDGTVVRPPEVLIPHPDTAVGDLMIAVGTFYSGSLQPTVGEQAFWTDRNAVLGTGVAYTWWERIATLDANDTWTRNNVALNPQNFFCVVMLTLKKSATQTPAYLQIGTIQTPSSTTFPVLGMSSVANTEKQLVITFYARQHFSGISYGSSISMGAPANHTVVVSQTGYTTGAGGFTYSWRGVAISTAFEGGLEVPADDIPFTPSTGSSTTTSMNSRYALA